MVCVRRPDGRPKRTVDLPLNKFCKREEWVTNTPAKQARTVPKNAWKSVRRMEQIPQRPAQKRGWAPDDLPYSLGALQIP